MTAATVYIVDDDDDVRRAIAFLLKTAQYSVQTFSSGQAFLESSPNSFPACLLSDIRMAGMNGFELQREVMKRFRGLPIIFMTGHGDELNSDACNARGCRRSSREAI